ncbi:MAG: L-seryl-tRNA(Sec) selenium transferase [Verrucomicrobiales bacterium]|nr:L-seryl-tRNA(Sec) selenium transferase [Verrucomicrobiales bacterium]
MANLAPQRALPSVDRVLQALAPFELPRPMVVRIIRDHLAALRHAPEEPVPAFEALVGDLRRRLVAVADTRLQAVINGTGILAHTNLGRAPLGTTNLNALRSMLEGYSNLEFALSDGRRGSRGAYLEFGLSTLCHAEAATVVNNCAAALVLLLHHFVATSHKREVVISRGELIQIGGGFRIPEILESSGATLREIGTTNRTSVDDYRQGVTSDTALILRVHHSNFFMEGFVDRPTDAEIAGIARSAGIPFIVDLGSGALVDIASISGLHPEPLPGEVLEAGADLVCFSGDKLLGGPQAGIIAGRRASIDALKADPLFRALRCDKLVFAALQTALDAYLHAASRRDAGPPTAIPLVQLMTRTVDDLAARAARLRSRWGARAPELEVHPCQSQIGGGVSPRSLLPSVALRTKPRDGDLDGLLHRLRQHRPPLIGRAAEGYCWIDLRTVFPEQEEQVLEALASAFQSSAGEVSPTTGCGPA